jgi:hypothetical protein
MGPWSGAAVGQAPEPVGRSPQMTWHAARDGRHRTAPAPILGTVLALMRIACHTTAEWSRPVTITL